MTCVKVAALIVRDGRVLTITASNFPDVYTLPGGPNQPDVAPERALAVWLRAELGVTVAKPPVFRGSYDLISSIDGAEFRASVFLVEVDGDPVPAQPGRRLAWVDATSGVRVSTLVEAVLADAAAEGLIPTGDRHG